MKTVIFDFDGTLANTLPICFDGFQHVFKEFDNRDLTQAEIKAMFGPSETGIIRENLINPNKEKAIALYYDRYLANHSKLVKPNAEILAMVKQLRDSGKKLGIVTGKARKSLDISLKALQMEQYFDVIITGDDVLQPKPHPEGIKKALAMLGVESDDAMFIGDSDADIQAGIAADVYPVGVQWLGDGRDATFETEPYALFTSVSQFTSYLPILG